MPGVTAERKFPAHGYRMEEKNVLPGPEKPPLGSLDTSILRSCLSSESNSEGAVMTKAEDAAQAELLQIVDQLESIRFRLTEIVESLPMPRKDTGAPLSDEDMEEDMDTATEVRTTIQCVLNDNIQPAIRDFRTVAAYKPKGKGAR